MYENISLHYSQNEKYFVQICREYYNTHFMYKNIFPLPFMGLCETYCAAVQEKSENLIEHMCFAYCITKGKNTQNM